MELHALEPSSNLFQAIGPSSGSGSQSTCTLCQWPCMLRGNSTPDRAKTCCTAAAGPLPSGPGLVGHHGATWSIVIDMGVDG